MHRTSIKHLSIVSHIHTLKYGNRLLFKIRGSTSVLDG